MIPYRVRSVTTLLTFWACGSLLTGRCQAEAGRNGLRPVLVKSRFMRTECTQNSHWSEVPHELISCKYITRTTFRNVILKLAFNQWHLKP